MNHQLIAHLREQYKIAVLDIPNQVTKSVDSYCSIGSCNGQQKLHLEKQIQLSLTQELRCDKVKVWAIEYLRNHPEIGFSFTKAKLMQHVNYFQLYELNMSAEEYLNYMF